MSATEPMQRPAAPGRLTLVLVVAVVLFSAHDVWARRASALELATLHQVIDRTLHGVVELVEMRSLGSAIRAALHRASEVPPAPDAGPRAAELMKELQTRFDTYKAAPEIDEAALGLRRSIEGDLGKLDAALGEVLAAEPARRQQIFDDKFVAAFSSFAREVADLISENAREASRSAEAVATHDAHAGTTSLLLLIGLATAVVLTGLKVHRTLARSQVEEARRLEELDAFSARVAHDLRGPLSPITLAIGMIEHNEGLTDGQRRSLAAAQRSVSRMVGLIDGLLRFARAGARPDPGACARLDQVVSDQVSAVSLLASEEKAEIVSEVESGLAVAASEPVVQSILENLLRNAVLHLGGASCRRVTVRARGDGAEVVLEVTDTGPGIPPDVAARLFRPFERATERPGGVGLGLATVKRLAVAHGGSVVLRSALGEGSTFLVRLPRFTPRNP